MEIPPYKGKPTLYLDQNILDLFVKSKLIDFRKVITDSYQIIYSDETLNEIKRSVGYESLFLDVLCSLNAFHIQIKVEQPNFVITNQALISNSNPYEEFEAYNSNTSDSEALIKSSLQSSFKFSGGLKGLSLSDIHENQISIFNEYLDSHVDLLDSIPLELREEFISNASAMKEQYRDILKTTEITLKENIIDERNWNGLKNYRDAVGIGPKELNNIDGPDVLEKIWQLYKSKPPYSNMNLDIHDFFCIKNNFIFPDLPLHNHQKVTAIYRMLDTIGYYPDSNINKERRFIASMSDNSHAAMASFCDHLMSRDMNFIKKVSAAYEFLRIPTIIYHL